MPVVLPLPLTIPVYTPGFSVATIADSRSLVGGMPVAWISCLLGVSPVIVRDRGKAARTVQFEHRISQRHRRYRSCVNEGPMARKSTRFGRVSRNDEAADSDVIARPYSHPGGEVDGLGRRRGRVALD